MQATHNTMAVALAIGIALPILYFAIQAIAAPFYPDYSFLSRDASTLGSDGSQFPILFNASIIGFGVLTLIASWGVLRAFQLVGVHPVLTWLTVAALILNGLSSINAGLFPLPDPRHTTGFFAILGAGMFLLPILLLIVFWKMSDAGAVKVYLIVNLIIFLALIPIMSGLIQRVAVMSGLEFQTYQNFLNNSHGLLQRIAAATVYIPIGVVCYFLAKRGQAPVQQILN